MGEKCSHGRQVPLKMLLGLLKCISQSGKFFKEGFLLFILCYLCSPSYPPRSTGRLTSAQAQLRCPSETESLQRSGFFLAGGGNRGKAEIYANLKKQLRAMRAAGFLRGQGPHIKRPPHLPPAEPKVKGSSR